MYTRLFTHLTKLNASSSAIEASALITIDGLIIEATFQNTLSPDNIGAIGAAAILLGQHASEKCASGMLEQVIIKCEKNMILLTSAGNDSILLVIMKNTVNLDAIFLKANEFICNIQLNMNETNVLEQINPHYHHGRGWVPLAY